MARAATAPARAPRTAPRPRPAPPRRRSGGATVPKRAPAIGRVLEAPAARMLDALLMGRAWIVLIGALLAGIVFFNVSLLGLNQGITRDSEKAQTLDQQNAELRLQVAALASTERIEQLAAKKGFTMPAAGAVGYLRSNVKQDAHRALARMESPQAAPVQGPQSATPQSATPQSATPQSATPQSAISAQAATPQPAIPAQPTTP